MFSTAPVDVTAKNLYDSKIKKLKKEDKKFMEVGQIASQHITRLTEWINEHKKLALADYILITSLNKEAAELGDNNRRHINAALNEVIEALEACEEKCDGEEETMYSTAQEYLSGANRVFAAKIARVMLKITTNYGLILAKHNKKVSEERGGTTQNTQATTPTITPSSSIQHIAPAFSTKELTWGSGMDEYNEWKAKVSNFFTGNENNYLWGHTKSMIIATLDAKSSRFVESYTKDDTPCLLYTSPSPRD